MYLVDIKVLDDGIKASVQVVQKIHNLERRKDDRLIGGTSGTWYNNELVRCMIKQLHATNLYNCTNIYV